MTLLLPLLMLACPPAATPSGPLATDLRAALARRGVGEATDGCAAVAVHIAPQGAGVIVTRPSRAPQSLPDLETAALLVETWVRADLIDPLLAARRGPPPPPAAPAPLAPPVVVTRPSAPPAPARALFLRASGAGGGASDGSTWLGAEGQGCIELGPTCSGLTARLLVDGGTSGDSKIEEVWRWGISVLASTEFDLGLLRVGGGAGVMTVRVDSKNSKADDVRGAPLFEARLARAFSLDESLALDIGAAGDLALWARHGRRNSGNDGNNDDERLIGQPNWFVVAQVGLRWSIQ